MVKRKIFIIICFFAFLVNPAYVKKLSYAHEKPIIVLAAFGTSPKGMVVYKLFEKELRQHLPGHKIYWALTSDKIRKRVNAYYAQKGIPKRIYSLREVLAKLEAEGHRQIIVQPLLLLPGSEYQKILNICRNFSNLEIQVGKPLFYYWENVFEVLEIISKHFYTPEEGFNLVVGHGVNAASSSANNISMALQWELEQRYKNVRLATLEGVPSTEVGLKRAIEYPKKKVRLIPLLYSAGYHVTHDLMGKNSSGEEKSWREILEKAGKEVDIVTTKVDGKVYYKTLGFYPEINKIFIRNILLMYEKMSSH